MFLFYINVVSDRGNILSITYDIHHDIFSSYVNKIGLHGQHLLFNFLHIQQREIQVRIMFDEILLKKLETISILNHELVRIFFKCLKILHSLFHFFFHLLQMIVLLALRVPMHEQPIRA